MEVIRTKDIAAGALLVVTGWLAAAQAQTQTVIVGGDAGEVWRQEGAASCDRCKKVDAIVIRGAHTVERTNAPGGVIDFNVESWENWIFPQRADTTQNIMLALEARGGSMFTPTFGFREFEESFSLMIDNEGDTALEVRADEPGQSANAFGMIIQFDLGAIFGVNRIKFFPRNADPDFRAPRFPFQRDFLKGFEIFVNDGAPENERNNVLLFPNLDGGFVPQNEDAVVDLQFEPRFVRHLRLKSLTNTDFEIAEFQIFTRGYVPEATYVSNVFDFDEPTLLGNIRWVLEHVGDPFLATAQIRTRTGVDPQPIVYPRVGLQASGRVVLVHVTSASELGSGGMRPQDIPIDALWKRADEFAVSDSLETPAVFAADTLHTLHEIVTGVLDNTHVDGREALLFFSELPLESRLGLEIDRDYYAGVADGDKRNLRDDLINWSAWSAPYSLSGAVDGGALASLGAGVPIASPSPRQYFQFMVRFDNDSFDSAAGIGGLAFDVSRPALTDSLIAEIVPRTASVGESTAFTYAVLNRPGPRGIGFDQLEIDTPLRTSAVREVVISGSDGVTQRADFSGLALNDEALPLTVNDITITEVRDKSFVISFPRMQSGGLITVDFDNAVLRFGTQFTARVRNADNPFVGQSVLAGNAADLSTPDLADPDPPQRLIGSLHSRNLSVVVPLTPNLLVNVEADPPVFTPNGDGTNDRSLIRFDLTNIAAPTSVRIKIYDLSGRLIVSSEELRSSGRFAWPWDGTDAGGDLTPPGNYIFSVSLDAGPRVSTSVDVVSTHTGVIAVAY